MPEVGLRDAPGILLKARIDAPGGLHHFIVRGIERRKIFKDNIDRISFLDRLGKVLSETVGDWPSTSLKAEGLSTGWGEAPMFPFTDHSEVIVEV